MPQRPPIYTRVCVCVRIHQCQHSNRCVLASFLQYCIVDRERGELLYQLEDMENPSVLCSLLLASAKMLYCQEHVDRDSCVRVSEKDGGGGGERRRSDGMECGERWGGQRRVRREEGDDTKWRGKVRE